MPSDMVTVTPSNRVVPTDHQQTPKHQKQNNPDRHRDRDRSQHRRQNPSPARPPPPLSPRSNNHVHDHPQDLRLHPDNGHHYQQYHQHHHQNSSILTTTQPISNGLLNTKDVTNRVGVKELDTASDKQNQNTWFVTPHDRDQEPIPVIPLFTHTPSDFHKNNGHSDPVYTNNCPNNFIHYSNGYPYPPPQHVTPVRRNNFVGGGGHNDQQDLLNMGRIQELRTRMSVDQVKLTEGALWKLLAAEFLGTALLMILGVGSVLKLEEEPTKALNFAGVALCWGLAVATLAQSLGGVSCDINPAVTLGKLVTGKTNIVKAVMYIVIQCLGALAGVAFLKAITPDTVQGDWGITKVAAGLTPFQGCFIEVISTFILVFTVFSVSDENRQDIKGSAPLAIGLSVAAIVMVSGPLTGASLNPARSLGPSIIAGHFDDHWVYWLGPVAGGVIAALVYEHVFRQLRPDEVEALEAEMQLRQREREAKENGGSPAV